MFFQTLITISLSLLPMASPQSERDPCEFETCRIRFTVQSATDRHFTVQFFGNHLMSTPIAFVGKDSSGDFFALEGCTDKWRMTIFDESGEFQANVALGTPSNGVVNITVGENNQKLLIALVVKDKQCVGPAPKDDPLPALHFTKPGENIESVNEAKQSYLKSVKESVRKETPGDFRSQNRDFDVAKRQQQGEQQNQMQNQHQTLLPQLLQPEPKLLTPTIVPHEQHDQNETYEEMSQGLVQTPPEEQQQQELRNATNSPTQEMRIAEVTPTKGAAKSAPFNEKALDFEKMIQHDSVINMCNFVCSRRI